MDSQHNRETEGYLWGFLTPPVAGADLRAALVASCFLGALPPVDLRAVCFVRAMALETWTVMIQRGMTVCGETLKVWTSHDKGVTKFITLRTYAVRAGPNRMTRQFSPPKYICSIWNLSYRLHNANTIHQNSHKEGPKSQTRSSMSGRGKGGKGLGESIISPFPYLLTHITTDEGHRESESKDKLSWYSHFPLCRVFWPAQRKC